VTIIDLTQAVCTVAAHHRAQWPADGGAEVAFAGRSNVGKSSALNAIAGRKQLARASKTPGRTRQIVFFEVGGAGAERRLVDLPGYGYAKVPDQMRRHWETITAEYLTRRACLKALVLPTDIRRPLTELDQLMLSCCAEVNLPAHILLTKADKLSRARAAAALQKTRAQLTTHAEVTVQLFSAVDKRGVEEAREKVRGWLTG